MNIEIKFRGKVYFDVKVECIDYSNQWVYGSAIKGSGGYYIANILSNDTIHYLPVHTYSVGQFIGRKDKNGKEMYHGDIICHGDPRIRYVIQWHDTGFRAKQIGSSSYVGIEYWLDVTEVIGNAYDNPDLLKR